MKFLTMAAVAAGLFATQFASAQIVYDAIANATVANYYTGPCNNHSGDICQVNNASATYNTLDVVYVATAPGTYTVCVNQYPPAPPCPGAFTGLPVVAVVPCTPITIPPAGPGDPPFPQVWILTFAINPALPIGPVTQPFEFISSSPNFSTAYDNSVAISTVAPPPVDINGFTIDLNCNGLLEPCPPVNEWFTFGTGANWNLLFALYNTPAPSASCALTPSVNARRLDSVPAKKIDSLLQTRIDMSL